MPLKKPDSDELRQLTEQFRRLGATNPDVWAKSELEEGIPQLAIYCFAKAIWQGVVNEDDVAWIDREIEQATQYPTYPCAAIGPALDEMLAKGVSRRAITDLVRVMQYHTLYHVCSLIDGSRVVDFPIRHWTLHQVDENGQPVSIIQGLHEVLLGLDPTGREMRPRVEG